MNDTYRTLLVSVSGRVQGVSFRVWTLREAQRLGLRGWVRNERDGSVRALISGPNKAVEAMLEALWDGPRGAAVTNVVAEAAEEQDVPPGFDITG